MTEGSTSGCVTGLVGAKSICSPGARASYSQARFNLAGRIIEKSMGLTYERAVASLLLEPLGLRKSFFARDDIITRRFPAATARFALRASGAGRTVTTRGEGSLRPCPTSYAGPDFHLGDGRAESGQRPLSAELLRRMHEPTATLRGSALGGAVGVGWFLRDATGKGCAPCGTSGRPTRRLQGTVKAVRHYDARGLLKEPTRDASDYRCYTARHALALLQIKTLAAAGVPLARVRELLPAHPGQFASALAAIGDPEFGAIYLAYDGAFAWSVDDSRQRSLADRSRRWLARQRRAQAGRDRPAPDPVPAQFVVVAFRGRLPAWDQLVGLATARRAAGGDAEPAGLP